MESSTHHIPPLPKLKKAPRDYTKYQIWLSLKAVMLCSMTYSIQIPFYPKVASGYGISPSQYGLVFGVFELSVVVCSLLCGRFMSYIGTKLSFITGLFVTGCSCILFGFLKDLADPREFLIFSFLCRILEAAGQAMTLVGIYTMIQIEFTDSVATMTAWTNTFFGIGMIVGPSAGGVLYDAGGFTLPFLFVGSWILICSILACFIFPKDAEQKKQDGKPIEVAVFLKIPWFWLGSAMVAVSLVASGYLQATLEPHLRVFDLTPSYLGLMFIIYGVSYAIMNPVIGKLLELKLLPALCMLIGVSFMCVGFSLIGPADFIPAEPSLELIIIGLIFFGVSCSCIHTPALLHMKKSCYFNGLKDTAELQSLISGIWSGSFSLGGFIGPTVAGFLYDKYGFRQSILLIYGLSVPMVILLVIFIIRWQFSHSNRNLDCVGRSCYKRESEESPILKHEA